ncbi:MAG: arabinose transporter [Alphaproteobacteria bacterium]|nr:arabinose transporter [Alphaproteobacteria bacterium]MBV9585897.1 arabinose transporter [Alphaproteobacteria bacterium]
MSDRALLARLSAAPVSPVNLALIAKLLPLDIAVFLVYLTIGAPLPVIPLFVHDQLGFDPIIVGIVIGAQAAATLLARPLAGGISDRRGTRVAVMVGGVISAFAGVFYFVGTLFDGSSVGSLVAIIAGRLTLGLGDSLFLTGAMAWGVQLGGPQNAGKGLMSVGIALYAAMAIGAPFGIAIFNSGGFGMLAVIVTATPLVASYIAYRLPAQPVVAGPRIPLREVFGRIWQPGAGVALSGVGFAVIAAFITLYYQSRGWNGAAYGLTAFGLAFIAARLFFGAYPDRFGGARVALVCLAIEVVGQLMLWFAPAPAIALLGAALTGFGYSLAFPALCLEAVRRVPPQSRGSAIGAYVVCLDFSLASAGPVAGLLVAPLGYSAIYLLGGACAALAALLTISLLPQATSTAAPHAAE